MRSWALGLEVKDRLEHAAAVKQLPKEIHTYISISREAGAGGGEIANRLGQKLGWQVLDKELLDYMAEHYKMPRDLLDFVDESTSNWFHEVFGNWLDSHLVTQSEYVSRLGRIVLIAARHEHAVFVGRGCAIRAAAQSGSRGPVGGTARETRPQHDGASRSRPRRGDKEDQDD